MEEITITLKKEQIIAGINQAFEEVLKSSYRNPIKDIIEAELKGQGEVIKKFVQEILASALTDEGMKEEMRKAVITKLVSQAFN